MKVIGIGLGKTGTTTLGVCLKTLGYTHCAYRKDLVACVLRGEMEPVFEVADQIESFEDFPWPLIYKEMDARYPGSKFILTTRATSEKWLESIKHHAQQFGPSAHRKRIYGHVTPHGHEEDYLASYEAHNRAVREYFKGREGDLLEVCWETGSGWEDLCAFLGKEVPDTPFPHARKRQSRMERFLRTGRRILRRLYRRIAGQPRPA